MLFMEFILILAICAAEEVKRGTGCEIVLSTCCVGARQQTLRTHGHAGMSQKYGPQWQSRRGKRVLPPVSLLMLDEQLKKKLIQKTLG